MEYVRYAYISVLGLLIVLSGCFGLTSDSSADDADEVEVEQNLAPIVTAFWMEDSTRYDIVNPGWNITVYHAMTDWDGNISEAGWDVDLDGSIDYPISSPHGLSSIFIPEYVTVNYSENSALASIVFGAMDNDGAWSSSPLITVTFYSPSDTSNTYTADDAADSASVAGDGADTLIKIQMTGSGDLDWDFVQITLSVGGSFYTCSVAAGDDCSISQQAGDNDNAWEPGEYIFLSEGTEEICSSTGCAVGISVTYGGNNVTGDTSVVVN